MKPQSSLSCVPLALLAWLPIAGCVASRTVLTGAQARVTDREVTVKLAPKPAPPPLVIDITVEPAHANAVPAAVPHPELAHDCPADAPR